MLYGPYNLHGILRYFCCPRGGFANVTAAWATLAPLLRPAVDGHHIGAALA